MSNVVILEGWSLILDTLRTRVRHLKANEKDQRFSLDLALAVQDAYKAHGQTYQGTSPKALEVKLMEVQADLRVWKEALRLAEEAAALFTNGLAPSSTRPEVDILPPLVKGGEAFIKGYTKGLEREKVQVLPDAGVHCPKAFIRRGEIIACTRPGGHDGDHSGQNAIGMTWCWAEDGVGERVSPDMIQYQMDLERNNWGD